MRKFLKYIFLFLISLIVIFLVVLLVLKIKNERFLGSVDKVTVQYLENNKLVSQNGIFSNSGLQNFFDDAIYQSDIILLGESHGYAEVQNIDKSLFLHFNKTIGVRYYLAEMDSICAGKLNNFLVGEDKNTDLLKEVVGIIKQRIPQQAGQQLFEKWSDIYDYNKQLPDSLRICVIGLDKSIGDTSRISRDSAMMKNFVDIIQRKDLQEEKFYGFFGLFHVLQSGMFANNFQAFGARLKNRGFRVKSLICFDVDSEVYFPETGQYPTPKDEKTTLFSMDGPILLVKGIKDFKKASEKNTITLFNVEKSDSPYQTTQKPMRIKMNFFGQDYLPYNENAVITDFFQYVVFLRNATAITPM